MPVVLVDPRSQMAKPFGGVLVDTGGGPLANGSLDEAFGFAIGARSVNASAGVSELQIAAGLGKEGGAEARTVVGHDAPDLDAEVGEVGHGLAEEAAGRSCFFIGQQGGEGDAGVVVDGDIQKLPAGAAGSSILILFNLSRVRMRLTVARLRPVDWAIRTPVQRSRRSRCTRSINSGEVERGERWGRELRSRKPGCFSVRKRRTHLAALCRLSLNSAAASFKLSRPWITVSASSSRR